jgi:hypothetical protein
VRIKRCAVCRLTSNHFAVLDGFRSRAAVATIAAQHGAPLSVTESGWLYRIRYKQRQSGHGVPSMSASKSTSVIGKKASKAARTWKRPWLVTSRKAGLSGAASCVGRRRTRTTGWPCRTRGSPKTHRYGCIPTVKGPVPITDGLWWSYSDSGPTRGGRCRLGFARARNQRHLDYREH